MVCRCRMVCRMVGVSKETLLVDLIKNGKIEGVFESVQEFAFEPEEVVQYVTFNDTHDSNK